MHNSLPDWAWFLGRPTASGAIRSRPEDFRVEELPAFEPSGEGSHLFLEVEKTGANTNWVAGELARAAGLKSRDIGFAGMKDRNGVTRQWFSLAMQEARNDDWANWEIEGVTLLQAKRHEKKLRRGILAGNRFRLVLRELQGDRAELTERLQQAAANGVPNYFGPQRFGHGGRNVQRARDWLAGTTRVRRNQRSIYLSAARSYLFNTVLTARVQRGDWNRLLDGDVAMLDGSRSVFPCTLPDAELERRCDAFDIHPTGPLPGRGAGGTERAADALESELLAPESALVEALARAGADAARRSLRLVPKNLEYEFEGEALILCFVLPPGAYATSLLRELVTTQDATISRP